MESVKTEKKEGEVNITLTVSQSQMLLSAISSGMIGLESFQKTASIVFGDKSNEPIITGLLKNLSQIGMTVKESIDKTLEAEKNKIEIIPAGNMTKV